jgi:hypothetical protein
MNLEIEDENDTQLYAVLNKFKNISMDESTSWIEKNKNLYREALKIIVKHPFKMACSSVVKLMNLYTGLWEYLFMITIGYPISVTLNNIVIYIAAIINIIYLFLAAYAFVYVRDKSTLRSSVVPLTVIVYFTVIHSVSCSLLRYSVPIFPFIIIFSANSLSKFLSKIKAPKCNVIALFQTSYTQQCQRHQRI